MTNRINNVIPYIPPIGLLLYVVIFFWILGDYPGGSSFDVSSVGYSHFHNFLCDLNPPIALNGEINHASSRSIIGHLFLSLGMICFFYILPLIFDHSNRNTRLVRQLGVVNFFFFVFMFTKYHDQIVFITGVLGTISLIPYFIELRSYPNKIFIVLSYTCFLMGVLVFLMFFTEIGYYYLPSFEKISFVFYAAWVFWVSYIVIQKGRINAQAE